MTKVNTRGATDATGGAGAAGPVVVEEIAGGATGPVVDEVRATDGAAVSVKGTSSAAAAAAEALAFGGAGAGVGGNRVVEAEGGPALRDVPLEGVDHSGDRPGAYEGHRFDRRGPFNGDLDDIAAGRRTGPFDAVGVATAARRPGRNAILPLAEPKLDPSLVPGVKTATAAAQVRRGGRSYAPGEKLPIDFKAHTELTAAGVIVAETWHDLPDHDDD